LNTNVSPAEAANKPQQQWHPEHTEATASCCHTVNDGISTNSYPRWQQSTGGASSTWMQNDVVPIAAPVVVQQETVFGDYKMI